MEYKKVETNKVYKHKARLDVNGGQKQYSMDFQEAYSPVDT
jgi:hypothetical protein